jgi:ABC-type thiamine transport system ATPase subunit
MSILMVWSKIAVVGPSGAGKSTIASLFAFLILKAEPSLFGKIFQNMI